MNTNNLSIRNNQIPNIENLNQVQRQKMLYYLQELKEGTLDDVQNFGNEALEQQTMQIGNIDQNIKVKELPKEYQEVLQSLVASDKKNDSKESFGLGLFNFLRKKITSVHGEIEQAKYSRKYTSEIVKEIEKIYEDNISAKITVGEIFKNAAYTRRDVRNELIVCVLAIDEAIKEFNNEIENDFLNNNKTNYDTFFEKTELEFKLDILKQKKNNFLSIIATAEAQAIEYLAKYKDISLSISHDKSMQKELSLAYQMALSEASREAILMDATTKNKQIIEGLNSLVKKNISSSKKSKEELQTGITSGILDEETLRLTMANALESIDSTLKLVQSIDDINNSSTENYIKLSSSFNSNIESILVNNQKQIVEKRKLRIKEKN